MLEDEELSCFSEEQQPLPEQLLEVSEALPELEDDADF